MGRLPEAWIAPRSCGAPGAGALSAKLVALRSGLKAQARGAGLARGGHVPPTDLFGVAGNRLLDTLELALAFEMRVRSART